MWFFARRENRAHYWRLRVIIILRPQVHLRNISDFLLEIFCLPFYRFSHGIFWGDILSKSARSLDTLPQIRPIRKIRSVQSCHYRYFSINISLPIWDWPALFFLSGAKLNRPNLIGQRTVVIRARAYAQQLRPRITNRCFSRFATTLSHRLFREKFGTQFREKSLGLMCRKFTVSLLR